MALAVDADAAYHNIVDNGETALASHPVALAVADAAVGQDGGLVEVHATLVELLRERNLLWMKKVPAGAVDNLVRSMAEDVNDRVGGVEDVSILGEVCIHQDQATTPHSCTRAYRGS